MILLIAVVVLLGMLGTAIGVGTACAWFLHMPFHTGWHDVWQRPGIALIYAIIFGSIFWGGMLGGRSSD